MLVSSNRRIVVVISTEHSGGTASLASLNSFVRDLSCEEGTLKRWQERKEGREGGKISIKNRDLVVRFMPPQMASSNKVHSTD